MRSSTAWRARVKLASETRQTRTRVRSCIEQPPDPLQPLDRCRKLGAARRIRRSAAQDRLEVLQRTRSTGEATLVLLQVEFAPAQQHQVTKARIPQRHVLANLTFEGKTQGHRRGGQCRFRAQPKIALGHHGEIVSQPVV